jgi:hypothetical protein
MDNGQLGAIIYIYIYIYKIVNENIIELKQISARLRFEVSTAVTMKNAVFGDMTSCGSCMNRRFGRTYRLHHQGGTNQRDTKKRKQ